MKNLILLLTLVVTTCPAVSSASAVLIDFESLANGTTVTNQYPEAFFYANSGYANLVTRQPGIGVGNNFLCTGLAGRLNCTQETFLNFITPVNNLTFLQVGDNATGIVALVDVFENHLFSSTVKIYGNNDFYVPNLVNLTAFNNITSIRIHGITDPGGLGWDNFSFNTLDTAAVPLPGTVFLFGIGLLGFAGMNKKKSSYPQPQLA